MCFDLQLWHTCRYVVYTRIHMCMYVDQNTYVYVYQKVCTRIHLHVYQSCRSKYICVCISKKMYPYTYMCMYTEITNTWYAYYAAAVISCIRVYTAYIHTCMYMCVRASLCAWCVCMENMICCTCFCRMYVLARHDIDVSRTGKTYHICLTNFGIWHDIYDLRTGKTYYICLTNFGIWQDIPYMFTNWQDIPYMSHELW